MLTGFFVALHGVLVVCGLLAVYGLSLAVIELINTLIDRT